MTCTFIQIGPFTAPKESVSINSSSQTLTASLGKGAISKVLALLSSYMNIGRAFLPLSFTDIVITKFSLSLQLGSARTLTSLVLTKTQLGRFWSKNGGSFIAITLNQNLVERYVLKTSPIIVKAPIWLASVGRKLKLKPVRFANAGILTPINVVVKGASIITGRL